MYVASSWRNDYQAAVVEILRDAGHSVYDFKNPPHGMGGFQWSEIDPEWQTWTPEAYRNALQHPIAKAGYQSDYDAMMWADTFVLVLPCGRSAHLELGWAAGAGKNTCILLDHESEPELMAKMADHIASDSNDVLRWLGHGVGQTTA
ncbi:MAG: hypothetical protein AAFR65_11205 [Pseudomonadota bacterium]